MNHRRNMLSALLTLLPLLLCGCAGIGSETSLEPGGADELPAYEDSSGQEDSSAIFITFEAADLAGNTVSEDVFTQSKLTMVNVWATYCGPCLQEMPGLGELAAAYDRSEFQIIGIVSDVREGESLELVETLVEQTGAEYPHLLANDSIGQALLASVTAVPTTFFFDGEGMYLGGVVGSAEKSAWEELIHELLENQ